MRDFKAFVKEHLGLVLLGLGILIASGFEAFGGYIAIIGLVILYRKYGK